MAKKIVLAILIVSLVLAALAGCYKTPRRFNADSSLDIATLNEVFHLDLGSDAKIVDHSFTESSYGDGEDDYETILDAVVELPADKYGEYLEMIDKNYIAANVGDEFENYSGALKRAFEQRNVEPDAVFMRYDSYKTEDRVLFWGSETDHPFTPIVGIEKGETAVTLYLHSVVY